MRLLKVALACLMLTGCAVKTVSILAPVNPENVVRMAKYVSNVGILYSGIYVKTPNKEYFKAIIPNGDGKGNDAFITFNITNDDQRARIILSDKEIGQ